MADISVRFSNKLNGYNKSEVDQFVKDTEAKFHEDAAALVALKQQVADLEARLNKIIGSDETVEEKIELYDKLMKKMDGDYTNLLAPAVAKAQAIREKAEQEYAVRMDQARYTAEGIYAETAERITGLVDANMQRIYSMVDEYLYSKSLHGRITKLIKNCKVATIKVAQIVSATAHASVNAYQSVKDTVQERVATAKDVVIKKMDQVKQYAAKG